MNIKVLFFAQFREAWGGGEHTLNLPDESRVDDAYAVISELPPFQPLRGMPLRFAVNESFQPGSCRLRDGDRLALIMPVAGG